MGPGIVAACRSMILGGFVGSSEAVLTTRKSLKDTESQSAGLTYFRSSSNMFKPFRASNTSCWGKVFSHRLTLQKFFRRHARFAASSLWFRTLRTVCGTESLCRTFSNDRGFASFDGGILRVISPCILYIFLCPTHIWYKIHTTVRMHHYVALQVCDLEEHVGVYCTVGRETHSLRTCLLWNMACSWMKLTLSVRRRHIAAMDNLSQS